jgi:hypothetical protein
MGGLLRKLDGGRGILLALTTAIALPACTANVVLRRNPGSDTGTLGPFQRCDAGEKACVVNAVQDSSLLNAANTTYFTLPSCPYGIAAILVQNSGSSNAVAVVQCAGPAQPTPPSSGAIPTTVPGGGTRPGP